MTREEAEYYKPCSTCHNDECVWIGTQDTHLICEDYKSQTEWIPVSKELPKEGEEVLVWYEYFRYGDYNCMWQTYGIGWQYNEHFIVDNGGVKQRVIAWQPLPKPYSEVSE